MILTTCAACAAPLAHDAPRCVRCKTRYCDATCQHDHWRRGHKQICKKIHRGGNAEQYNADKKYKEAVAVAVEACADDTKGQTCYICTQALHWKTKEGLVRGCACRGTAGFVHVSCLAEQAKILVAEGMENNLGSKGSNGMNQRWQRWEMCSMCEQSYHGLVRCAVSWACWKTYVGRPEADQPRQLAMNLLGIGLTVAHHHKDALIVKQAELATARRFGASKLHILSVQGNLASTYQLLGRLEETCEIYRDVYSGTLKLIGEERYETLSAASNLANLLVQLRRFEEAKSLMCRHIPVARRLREKHDDLGAGFTEDLMLRMKWIYAQTLYKNDRATLNDLREAVMTLEELALTARRVLGDKHPMTGGVESNLRDVRAFLRAREASSKTTN